MAIELLKIIVDIGAVVYDFFFALGSVALTPVRELSTVAINYTNPLSNVVVTLDLTNSIIIDLLENVAYFFDNKFFFTYAADSFFQDNFTVLGAFISIGFTLLFVRVLIALIAAVAKLVAGIK